MKRFFRELVYDIKEPGIHIWILPLVSLAFIMTTYIIQKALDSNLTQNILTLPLLELLIPSMGGYGALMLMQGILDTEGGELAFSYPRTYLYWGLIRHFRFFGLYTLLIAVVCKAVTCIMRIDFAPVFYLTLAQSFAVMAVSFLGVTLSKKVSTGLIILVAFVGIQITIGWEFDAFNRIYLINGEVPTSGQIAPVVLNSLVIGFFGWGIGQAWLRP